jgi:hypothetical protein
LKGADFSQLKSVPTPPKKETPKSDKTEKTKQDTRALNSAETTLNGAKQDTTETVDLKAIASFYHKDFGQEPGG